MRKGSSGDGGELAVISAYDNFAIEIELEAPYPLLRGAGGPANIEKI